jgi:hypothetical protein
MQPQILRRAKSSHIHWRIQKQLRESVQLWLIGTLLNSVGHIWPHPLGNLYHVIFSLCSKQAKTALQRGLPSS